MSATGEIDGRGGRGRAPLAPARRPGAGLPAPSWSSKSRIRQTRTTRACPAPA